MPDRDGSKSKIGGAAPPRSVARDTLSGAILGAVLGGVLLGVGLIRGLGAILLGRHLGPPTPQDLHMAAYYVGSFTVAGAGLGAAKPLLRTRLGTYVGFGLAGATVGIAISLARAQGDADAPPLIVILILGGTIGAIMGCAFARGSLRAHG